MLFPRITRYRPKHLTTKPKGPWPLSPASMIVTVVIVLASVLGWPGSVMVLAENPYFSDRIGVGGCSNTRYAVLEYGKISSEDVLWTKIGTGGGHLAAWADIEGEGLPYWSGFESNLETLGAGSVWFQICIRAAWTSEFGMTPEQQEMLTTIVDHIRALTSSDTEVFVSPINEYEEPVCSAVGPYGVENSIELADWAAETGLASRGPDTGPLTQEMLASDLCHPNKAGRQFVAQQLVDFFDDDPPSVTIAQPVEGGTITGDSVSIAADVNDDNGVTAVDFYFNGVHAATDRESPFEAVIDSTSQFDGPATITVTATDTVGKTGSSTIGVMVENGIVNTPPTPVIDSDGSGTIYTATGQPVTFDGSTSSDQEGWIVAYSWDFGDGGTAEGSIAEHSYTAPGSYTASLTVVDDGGLGSTATVSVVVADDDPPSITITNPLEFDQVTGVTLVSAEATDDLSIAEVAFLVDGVVAATDFEPPYELTWDTTALYDGDYLLTAVATDSSGQIAAHDVVVSTLNGNMNTPPTAVIDTSGGGVLSAPEGVPITFDGSLSSDAEGTIVSHTWDFGDGTTGNAEVAEHVYPLPGSYTAVLVVTDDGGLVGEASVSVEVTPDSVPTVAVLSPLDGESVSGVIDVIAEANDDIGIVDVGFYLDGVLMAEDSTPPYQVAWDTTTDYDSSHEISVIATDTAGQTSTHLVAVDVSNGNVNTPPLAIISNDGTGELHGEALGAVVFDGSPSTDSEGTIVSYLWDLGDGASKAGSVISHSYQSAGTYTATLTVTDDGGLVGSASITVVIVEPAGITVLTEGPLASGEPITFVDSSNQGTFRRRWHMGDGVTVVTNNTTTLTYTYAQPGVYTVLLETKDADGVRVTLSTEVTVN